MDRVKMNIGLTFSKVRVIYQTHYITGLLFAIGYRIFKPRLLCFKHSEKLFSNKIGLEIGGPSSVFSRTGLFPVYPKSSRIDNCNFSSTTIWEGVIQEGMTFKYDKLYSPGYQYLADAVDLSFIPSNTYDFVLSSHSLEHIANPLKALGEWKRVLKENGTFVLVLPNKEGTFDHRRPTTTLAHLIEDFEQDTSESDLTHLPEILALHDLKRDPSERKSQSFKERCENNFQKRAMHHHVFEPRSAVDVLNFAGFQISSVETFFPYHIFTVSQKLPDGKVAKNDVFFG